MKRFYLTILITLSGLLPLCAAASESLQQRFVGLDSFSAEFTQKLFDSDQKLQEESHGLLRVQRPDRFNLEYTQPYQQYYVADGTTLSFYDKDLEQVTLKPQKGMLDNTPAMVLSNPAALGDDYRITPQGDEAGLSWFDLVPKKAGSNFEKLSLAFKGNSLRVMEMYDSFGQVTRLDFTQVKRNPDLDPKLFHFTPPKGVDVIQQ